MISTHIIIAFLSTGLLAGLVSGLFGLGGGVVVVPLLAYLLEQNHWGDQFMQIATGTSQAVILCTTTSALLMHHRKMSIAWRMVFVIGIAASIGSVLGRYIIHYIPSKWLSITFFIFIIYTVKRMLFNASKDNSGTSVAGGSSVSEGDVFVAQPAEVKISVCSIFGFTVGVFVSMLGIGGGAFIVPFLLHYGFSMVQASAIAIGAAVLISLSSTIGALLWWRSPIEIPYLLGQVYLPAWGFIAIASICSAPMGVHWAHKLDSNRLKRYFAIFLLGIALHLLWRMYLNSH